MKEKETNIPEEFEGLDLDLETEMEHLLEEEDKND